jgi:hypothetical protein
MLNRTIRHKISKVHVTYKYVFWRCDEKADVKDQDTLQLYTDSLQKYFLDW